MGKSSKQERMVSESMDRETRKLVDDLWERRIGRREFIKRAVYLGVGASLMGSVLGACGGEESGEGPGERVARLATENEDGEHPLNGQNISMTVLGIGGWLPSELAVNMAPMFNDFAKENYGYTVNFSFDEAPFASLFQKAASSLGTQSQEYNIIISDSQWLGALAEPGWIVQMNDFISSVPALQNVEWYSDIVRTTYMIYPENSDQIWGLPQEGDTAALYLRKDMLEDPAEQQAFQQQYGRELPRTYDDFVDMTMSEFEDIAEFFTRPDQGLWGTLMQYSKEYDYASLYYYHFVFSQGGEIWDPETHNVYGILNTEQNAAALEEYKRWLKYMPPGAEQVGIAEEIDAFTQGRVFSAFQWAAVGLTMITDELKDKVLVAVPPKHEDQRTYSIGGQPWVINAFNDDAHMRVATDYLRWWYLPETQVEFARQGGNPCTKAALEDPEFDNLNPWNKAFKYMLQEGRSRDFWKDPSYSEMLSVQQEAFTAYVTGQVDDPMRALNYAACRQQSILNEAGRADEAPPDSCGNISL